MSADSIAEVVAELAARHNATIEALVIAIGVDPSELCLTERYIDGMHRVEARHIPSNTIAMAVGPQFPEFVEHEDDRGQYSLSVTTENVRAKALYNLWRKMNGLPIERESQ